MILEKIRMATSSAHKELEDSSLMSHFSDLTITRPIYIEILNRFYGYFYPLELTLNRYSEISAYLPDYHQRRKSHIITEDLRNINGLYSEPDLCANLPVIDSAGKAFGCLYAMEESVLAGKTISRILEERLGITNTTGAAFFYRYSKNTGQKWKAFREALGLFSLQYNNDDEIISGASDTFVRFREWLNECESYAYQRSREPRSEVL